MKSVNPISIGLSGLLISLLILFPIIISCDSSGTDVPIDDDGGAQLTDEQIDTFFAGQDSAGNIWDEQYALHGDSWTAREQTVQEILLIEGVEDAGINDDSVNIWIEYESGISGGLFLLPPELYDMDLPSSAVTFQNHASNDDLMGARVANPGISRYSPPLPGQEHDITNSKVLIWESDYKLDVKLEDDFTNTECMDWEVTHLLFDQCTIESIKNFPNYGTVVIEAHGGQAGASNQIAFMSGEESSNASMKKYSKELKKLPKQLIIYKGQRLPERKNYYLFTESLISQGVSGAFPNSIIYASSCFGLYNDSMADAFIDKGAGVFIGFSGKTCLIFTYHVANCLFPPLITGDTNLQNAFALVPKEDTGQWLSCAGEGLGAKIDYYPHGVADFIQYKCPEPPVTFPRHYEGPGTYQVTYHVVMGVNVDFTCSSNTYYYVTLQDNGHVALSYDYGTRLYIDWSGDTYTDPSSGMTFDLGCEESHGPGPYPGEHGGHDFISSFNQTETKLLGDCGLTSHVEGSFDLYGLSGQGEYFRCSEGIKTETHSLYFPTLPRMDE